MNLDLFYKLQNDSFNSNIGPDSFNCVMDSIFKIYIHF